MKRPNSENSNFWRVDRIIIGIIQIEHLLRASPFSLWHIISLQLPKKLVRPHQKHVNSRYTLNYNAFAIVVAKYCLGLFLFAKFQQPIGAYTKDIHMGGGHSVLFNKVH